MISCPSLLFARIECFNDIMKVKLRNHLEKLRTSYWFVPSIMLVFIAVLAFSSISYDKWKQAPQKDDSTFFYSGDSSSAQSLLSTVGGSAITVAGVVFSITITALTLASSQFGPRLLRNFMRDRGNQIVLGTFVSTYLYCLLVQRSLGTGSAVPHLSVTIGVMLGVASLCVLVYFIHHVASSIQASAVVANVGKELVEGIESLFPDELGEEIEHPAEDRKELDPAQAHSIRAHKNGYLQAVDEDRLLTLATKHDLIIHMNVRPGAFITACDEIALLYPKQAGSDERIEQIRATMIIDSSRSAEQDIEYSINQLVEICLRALSPSINDPLTAITCIDWLGAAISRLANRNIPDEERYDENKILRIISPRTTFGGAMDASFNQPRQAGSKQIAVMIRMLEVLETIARQCTRPDLRQVVRHHISAVWDQSMAENPLDSDVADLRLSRDEALRSVDHFPAR